MAIVQVSLSPTHGTSTEESDIRYPAYLETVDGGKTRAYVFRLPGLHVDGESPEDALHRLRDVVADEHVWLQDHGAEQENMGEAIEIESVERIRLDTDVSRGAWIGLFRYELRPTTPKDVAITLERAGFAREDVLRCWKESSPESRTAWSELLVRFAERELWLLSRLGSTVRAKLPEDPIEAIALARVQFEERIQNLLPGDIERLAVFEGEQWTTRKVLRQFVVGERELLRRIKEHIEEGMESGESTELR
jgi:predicted RNase H-like HicB family nuclease